MGDFAERLQLLSIQLVPFYMAIVFHEFAHGFIAYQWGDQTAKSQGRLTLNPIPHLDPIGTILFPVINILSGTSLLFGWAKPVPIDPSQFRKFRPGLFMVSLAGPTMNFLLAVISAFVFFSIDTFIPRTFYLFEPLLGMAYVSVSLNFALGIFNLIPLPPLDGSKVIEAFLPYRLAQKYESFTRYSFIILLGLLWSGALAYLSYPITIATKMTLFLVGSLFGAAGSA